MALGRVAIAPAASKLLMPPSAERTKPWVAKLVSSYEPAIAPPSLIAVGSVEKASFTSNFTIPAQAGKAVVTHRAAAHRARLPRRAAKADKAAMRSRIMEIPLESTRGYHNSSGARHARDRPFEGVCLWIIWKANETGVRYRNVSRAFQPKASAQVSRTLRMRWSDKCCMRKASASALAAAARAVDGRFHRQGVSTRTFPGDETDARPATSQQPAGPPTWTAIRCGNSVQINVHNDVS